MTQRLRVLPLVISYVGRRKEAGMGVAIGVDSHKSSLAVGALNEVGHLEEVREFTNDRRGHESLPTWIRQHGPERVIGIEGSGSYGAGLVRHLLEAARTSGRFRRF